MNTTKQLTTVNIDGVEPIVCTPEHPFYVLNAEDTPIVEFEERDSSDYQGEWVTAGSLEAGHIVLLSNEKKGIINSVETEELDEAVATYNFEVEDYHTYYVGSEGILVHNACGGDLVDDAASGADDAKVLKDPWGAERRGYWKSQGRSFEGNINGQLSPSENYFVTGKNVKRMLRGHAPIGIDGYSVHLHHTLGKSVDMYTYVEMTRTAHYANFKALHPWMYKG